MANPNKQDSQLADRNDNPMIGAQQTHVTETTIGANTGTPGAGLSLIGDTSTVDQSAALMNDLAALREDIASIMSILEAHGLMADS